MTDNIIPIAGHLPKPNAELVDFMKTLLSEAMNGRLVSFATVYVSNEGTVGSSHFFATSVDEIAIGTAVNSERVEAITK